MKPNLPMQRLIGALTTVLVGLAAQSAWAVAPDTLLYKGAQFSPYDSSYTVHDNDPVHNFTVSGVAGGFKVIDVTGNQYAKNVPFTAWCVDIFDAMNTSGSGASYNLVNGASFYTSGSSYINKDLERLASYVFDKATTSFASNTNWYGNTYASNVQSAAFQLAIWEIVDEKNGGARNSNGVASYNVSSGDFYVTGGDSAARGLANQWLGWLDSSIALSYSIDQDLQIWQQTRPGTTQNLAMFVPTVPEPETYVMLVAGLGLMGYVARRRRQRRIA